jgi:hypothetical protein
VNFIFMLARSDETIFDCLDTWSAIESIGLTHAGFKDVGADLETLTELNRRMQSSGVTTYLEVVSTSTAACLRSAQAAMKIGVDRLMGGTQVEAIMAILEGSGIGYLPFPGVPAGHPPRLGGSPDLVEEHCRAFDALGCYGVDLLAYRATHADPIELVRAARRGSSRYLVVTGSVSTAEQIDALREAGADAFTVGSAVFDGSFSPRKGLLTSRLRDVMEAARG